MRPGAAGAAGDAFVGAEKGDAARAAAGGAGRGGGRGGHDGDHERRHRPVAQRRAVCRQVGADPGLRLGQLLPLVFAGRAVEPGLEHEQPRRAVERERKRTQRWRHLATQAAAAAPRDVVDQLDMGLFGQSSSGSNDGGRAGMIWAPFGPSWMVPRQVGSMRMCLLT